nr:MAG TPA: hypothetical protein [Caudoviricetes sp.]
MIYLYYPSLSITYFYRNICFTQMWLNGEIYKKEEYTHKGILVFILGSTHHIQ